MADNKSFVFYESWANFIDIQDREMAKELVYQIYRVGLDKEIDTDNELIRSILKAFIIPNIKGAKRRYNTAVENGKKSKGAPPKTNEADDNLIWELHLDGLTYDEIVERMDTYGVSISRNTVGDRVRKRKELESTRNKNQELKPNTETNNETNTNTFKNKDKFIVKSENEEENESNNNLPLHYNFINNNK